VTNRPKLRAPTKKEHEEADRFLEATRYDRGPATGPIHWGLHVLHSDLASFAKLYRGGDLQAQRDAVSSSAISIQRYLNSQGINEQTVEPLMRVVSALVEREENRLDPLFCDRARDGAPARSNKDYDRIGAIATLANIFLKLRKNEDGNTKEKLQRFARKASCEWLGNLTYSRVKAAREMVAQEAKEHPAVSWANLYQSHFEEVEKLSDERVAYDMLLRFIQKQKIG
jgi:hypothetical protein